MGRRCRHRQGCSRSWAHIPVPVSLLHAGQLPAAGAALLCLTVFSASLLLIP